MTSAERHENRYQRRKSKRLMKKQFRTDAIGGVSAALSYDKLYNAGKKCCCGVRWKQSTQNFETHLFSKTAVNTRNVRNGVWAPGRCTSFVLRERGKVRPIDAPIIQDRQVHKAYTKNVLLPLYLPEMIWNNGASLEGKGFAFSRDMLVSDLHSFYRHYGTDGCVILLDFKQFFPSAPHKTLYERHERLILDDELRTIGDKIVASNKKECGMPLGVEPSQAEMIALPSELDNYIKCQLKMKYAGHYMDDYYILVPPHMDAKELLQLMVKKATDMGLTVSLTKTKISPICKPFKYCKAKYQLTSTGAVVIHGNRDGVKRARRKIKAFRIKVDNGEMTYEDLWSSVNGTLAGFEPYNDHNRILKLRRLFYALFGFSPERIENFRAKEREKMDEIYCAQTIQG